MQTPQVAESLAAYCPEKISDGLIAQWERMAAQTIALVGEDGFDALYTRSIYLAQPDFPWLGAIQMTSRLSPRFAELKRVLARQAPETASQANELLLQRFNSILASLIGEELTRSILRSPARPEASNGRLGAQDEYGC